MIEEFCNAESRRVAKAAAVKGDEHVLELQRGVGGRVSVALATTNTSRSNG